MAYQVISQNNTTTTLADENGNVIHVPARVNLATSTDYTITKVNNNTATLEDGNGNIIRDVPCVAVLYGEGGGSGLPDQTGHSGEFLTTDGTDASWAAVDALPSQTGQSGKFLTTDGTDASWSDKPLVNTATGTGSLGIGERSTSTAGQGIAIGADAAVKGNRSVCIGTSTTDTNANGYDSVVIGGYASTTAGYTLALGQRQKTTAQYAIQIGTNTATNSDANTFKVANSNGNFEMMSADGTIPTARFTTDPSADGTYYPTLTISSGTPTRSWSTISALQNINTNSTGVGIGTDLGGSTISVPGSVSIGTNVQASTDCVVIGSAARSFNKPYGVAIGNSSYLGGSKSIAIGYGAKTGADNAIQLNASSSAVTNSDANTFKVGNANGNFEIMDANGNLPADRLASTTGLADGNYRLRLTMASGVPTLSWVAE